MDTWTKMGETITEKGQAVVEKAKELAEIAGLKSQIGTCEEVMKKNYLELGRLYYQQYGAQPEAIFEKQCRAITNAKKGVSDLEQQIRDIKGI